VTISNNAAVLGVALQSAKGAPNPTPDIILPYTGTPSLVPGTQLVTLAETDASAQEGDDVVVGTEPGGGSEHYLRPTAFATIVRALMGAPAGGDYAPGVQEYFTLIEDRASGVMVAEYDDAKLSQLVLTAQNRGACTYQTSWVALAAAYGGGTIGNADTSESPLTWPMVQVIRAGAHPGTCNSITLTINRNLTRVPGDQGYNNIDAVAGLFSVTGEMVVLFEDDGDMRAFATGSRTGTVPTPAIYTESLELDIQDTVSGHGANFAMTEIQFSNVTTAVGTDATPAFTTLQFKTKRQVNIADNLTISLN
jgi:hypothetical protein